ncbi:putative glycerophosphoryl diester phosphodiesterase 1 [Novipirellula galeiformis]|uniref:Putative glycerophosphoryl diester phosphodiesterase 1 n=1 Tax=Novipirellula galeiformis TaxID=2528004 RepID=A0A5C6CBB9_9BACT|nr:glycerophosphodiester phosphodiesterase [Novipirellula galeiformis]TWU20119.1 putative glycerophosphoryl diester phosphodiesterase 1 [Novipirellula galeiformis]
MPSRLIPFFALLVSFSVSNLAISQMIVGHRGASYDAPENTLAAFQLAWDQNADGIEGDFYLTRDAKIVCIHDRDTKRTTGANLRVEDSTLAELRKLDAGQWKDPKWDSERIPTFAEVLQTVPEGRTFVIEIKSDRKLVPHLKTELDRLDHSKIKLLIICFDEHVIADCKRLLPEVKAHWLTGFKQNKDTQAWSPTADHISKVVKRSGADGVGMQGQTRVINADFIDSLKQNECDEFHVWTINSATDAKFFASLGAFGITTDRPAMIRDALEPVASR